MTKKGNMLKGQQGASNYAQIVNSFPYMERVQSGDFQVRMSLCMSGLKMFGSWKKISLPFMNLLLLQMLMVYS